LFVDLVCRTACEFGSGAQLVSVRKNKFPLHRSFRCTIMMTTV
jgi:hypothetical protein